MTLSTTAWVDGAVIPDRYTQAGEEVSPPLTWSNPPDGVTSFLLIVHDVDATNADGTTDTLHWMVWNIPPSSRGLPEHVGQGPEVDGTRQISVTEVRNPAGQINKQRRITVGNIGMLETNGNQIERGAQSTRGRQRGAGEVRPGTWHFSRTGGWWPRRGAGLGRRGARCHAAGVRTLTVLLRNASY